MKTSRCCPWQRCQLQSVTADPSGGTVKRQRHLQIVNPSLFPSGNRLHVARMIVINSVTPDLVAPRFFQGLWSLQVSSRLICQGWTSKAERFNVQVNGPNHDGRRGRTPTGRRDTAHLFTVPTNTLTRKSFLITRSCRYRSCLSSASFVGAQQQQQQPHPAPTSPPPPSVSSLFHHWPFLPPSIGTRGSRMWEGTAAVSLLIVLNIP